MDWCMQIIKHIVRFTRDLGARLTETAELKPELGRRASGIVQTRIHVGSRHL